MKESTKLLTLVVGAALTALGIAGLAYSTAWAIAHIGVRHFEIPITLAAAVLVVGVFAILYGGFQPHAPLVEATAEQLTGYPVTLECRLDEPLSRWLWLVKWILVLPHYIILFFLFIAFIILTIMAFLAILFTEQYPRSLFETNLGILRWAWRVGFYAYDVLGTDRYPPFTLQDVDYPARFNVGYPNRLSRGLVLVKWWLLAIPHYLVIGIFGSGAVWTGSHDHPTGGLLPLLVIFAAICLLVTGRYPSTIFDLVVGLNRWIYRVLAYVSLMRDEYPPFRLDVGAKES